MHQIFYVVSNHPHVPDTPKSKYIQMAKPCLDALKAKSIPGLKIRKQYSIISNGMLNSALKTFSFLADPLIEDSTH